MRLKSAPFLLLACLLIVIACSGNRVRDDGPGTARMSQLPDDPIPRIEARSRYGNGPTYEVFKKWYTVMDSSAGYRERGVASWYGKKFHGNLTSNREIYDMYEMTAAHKTLPLPTYVRVRNLRNNKSIIVRVNDRGPFAHNRIIDLSYAAALKLDMVKDGTSMVEVTAYPFDAPVASGVTDTSSPPRTTPNASLQSKPSVVAKAQAENSAENRIFVQVGAFGDRSNANRRAEALSRSGITGVVIHADDVASPALYRVRIGPVADVDEYDLLVTRLEKLGIADPYLISE